MLNLFQHWTPKTCLLECFAFYKMAQERKNKYELNCVPAPYVAGSHPR